MRDDMFKVIVERPRRIHSNAYKGDGRAFRNREDGPSRLGMNKGYNDRKGLNENLAPLKRFLERQVNRPWGKVYKGIRAAIAVCDTQAPAQFTRNPGIPAECRSVRRHEFPPLRLGAPVSATPSFPRTRESIFTAILRNLDSRVRGNDGVA